MKETIDLLGKIITNILTALYEPFGFSLLLSFLAMFFYLYDDDQRIDTILDVDNQRQSLKDLAEKYTSIRRKDYLEWRIRLEHEMTKAEEK